MGTKKLTARALNRATLARQLLLAREPLDVVEAVSRIVALQAQQPASPYIALWNRLSPFDPAALDKALTDHHLVRSTLMRITLHTVHADDYAPFREAMEPTLRGSRLGDPRFKASGLTAVDADAVLPSLLKYAEDHPRTAAELKTWLEDQVVRPLDTSAHRLLRQYAPPLAPADRHPLVLHHPPVLRHRRPAPVPHRPGSRRRGPQNPDPPLPGRLRPGDGRGHGPVRPGPPPTGEDGAAVTDGRG